jgi:hypothetical protein
MVKNMNKSNDGEKHVCDFCGSDPEEIWIAETIDGQYCFTHFRLMHDNLEDFDEWCKEFNISTD